jgi:hypothetical protein
MSADRTVRSRLGQAHKRCRHSPIDRMIGQIDRIGPKVEPDPSVRPIPDSLTAAIRNLEARLRNPRHPQTRINDGRRSYL